MNRLTLSGHQSALPVIVDHCRACRLVWFDALESVQLDALGWVHLLRELQPGDADPPPAAVNTGSRCPICSAPLQPVHNRSRFGRFKVLECPKRHGHLHSRSGLLAERGLVRTLLGPERAALRNRRIDCLNCGAPSDGAGDTCSYCGSPRVVIDLPRLAHALQLRQHDFGPSPVAAGQLVTWTCRGCGMALDPTLAPRCPQCAYPLLAPSLHDITPLLDRAEAELRAVQRRPPAASPPRRPTRPRAWQESSLALMWRRFGPQLDWHEWLGGQHHTSWVPMLVVLVLLLLWLTWA